METQNVRIECRQEWLGLPLGECFVFTIYVSTTPKSLAGLPPDGSDGLSLAPLMPLQGGTAPPRSAVSPAEASAYASIDRGHRAHRPR